LDDQINSTTNTNNTNNNSSQKTKKGKTTTPPKTESEKQKENATKQLQKLYTQIKHELSEKTSFYVSLLVDFDIDLPNVVNGLIDSSKIIQTIYYLLAKRHSQLIEKCYEKTIPTSPVDLFLYISQNFTPNFYLNPDTVVYYWDIDNKTQKRIENCWSNEFESINSLPFLQKADAFFSLISHHLSQ
jgi:hypothetical protein